MRAALPELPPPPPETVRDRLAYARYLAIWESAARLPDIVARRLPGRIGQAWYLAAPPGQRVQVRRNLRRVRPDASSSELTELVRAAYDSYARYWLDSFRLHRMDPAAVVAAAADEGLHHLDEVRDRGVGGIVATGHLGSWDVGALFTAQRQWGLVVVAEVVEPRRLFERFVALRQGAGIDVIPLIRGGNMVEQLQQRIIERGQIATLLADRDLTKKGPIVEFFGEPCRLPPGTAVLARRTGRPVTSGAFLTEGDGFRVVLYEPIDIAHLSVYDGTQAVARELERVILRAPEQWHVFVRNWLADREPHHPVVDAWRRGEDWVAMARIEREETAGKGNGEPAARADGGAAPEDR